jgi:CRP-like cAMP-binding protein
MFREIDAAKLKLMAFAGQRMSYRAGETVFNQGAESDAVFVILSGEVDVLRIGGAGKVLLARLGKTHLIGEMGVLCSKPRNAMIVAHSDLEALRIDKSTFLHIVNQVPQLAMAIIRELSARLDHVNEMLAARGPGSGE